MELENIKKLRKNLNMTQSELAKASNVSQSLIAKIESGLLDPSYSNAQKIISTLENKRIKDSLAAKDLMITKVLTCKPNDSIKNVISKMKKYGISQVPVVDKNIIGLVTEASLIDHILEDITNLKVSDVMIDAPPTISLKAPEKVILDILKHFPVTIVVHRGNIKGLITKSDILKSIF